MTSALLGTVLLYLTSYPALLAEGYQEELRQWKEIV